MLPDEYRWIIDEFEPEGDPPLLFEIGRKLEESGNLEGAATVYDRAFGLEPTREDVRRARHRVLDALAVEEHGLSFRYVPGGSFLMGSLDGEEDELPYHPVWLKPYWITETPICWNDFCRLMDCEPPPWGQFRNPPTGAFWAEMWPLRGPQVCDQFSRSTGRRFDGWENERPEYYRDKPMVALFWQMGVAMGDRLSAGAIRYQVPSEAQWEKAARGGLIGARYSWGDAAPNPKLCDCDRFFEYSIQPMKALPPNGYGLYAMNGCVWEWTRDWYDRDYYRASALWGPEGPAEGREKVLRGGSWADCPAVVTNTFRMSLPSPNDMIEWRGTRPNPLSPTIGFRLVRSIAG